MPSSAISVRSSCGVAKPPGIGRDGKAHGPFNAHAGAGIYQLLLNPPQRSNAPALQRSPFAAAFTACRALIDELKQSIPVWKHQVFGDGESEWVNSA